MNDIGRCGCRSGWSIIVVMKFSTMFIIIYFVILRNLKQRNPYNNIISKVWHECSLKDRSDVARAVKRGGKVMF